MTPTPGRIPDEPDALRHAAEARTILAKAGRRDLANLTWSALLPDGVPLRVRRDALVQVGYPFETPRLAAKDGDPDDDDDRYMPHARRDAHTLEPSPGRP